MTPVVDRVISFESCLNFRDLGGYAGADGRAVRWRRLFRSDSLHRMRPSEVDHLLDELGVVTVVDLRTTAEREHGGPVPAEGRPGVTARHVPMVDELFADPERRRDRVPPSDMGEGYAAMLRMAGHKVATVLGLLAEPTSYPAVFFCAAGKDRTGVLAALVLGLVGVSDDDIVADYALTDEVAPAILRRYDREDPRYEEVWKSLPPEARRAPGRVMASMLAAVRREHGSIEGYAESVGVGRDVVTAMRDCLLEPFDR